MKSIACVALLALAVSGCAFLEPSGCANVGIDFEPVDEVGAFSVNVTTEALQRDAPDLAAHALDAVAGDATSLHVPESEYVDALKGQLRSVDPDRTNTWVHPDGAILVLVTIC